MELIAFSTFTDGNSCSILDILAKLCERLFAISIDSSSHTSSSLIGVCNSLIEARNSILVLYCCALMRRINCYYSTSGSLDIVITIRKVFCNCICYTGTHDNHTLAGWLAIAGEEELSTAKQYFGLNEEEGFCRGVLRGGMSSVARLFVAQMQDWLELGDEARINAPGVPMGNWIWRMRPGAATEELAEEILKMTRLYGRTAPE